MLPILLVAGIGMLPQHPMERPIEEATARQIGLAQLRRWASDPTIEEVAVEKAGRCWIVWLPGPSAPADQDILSEPFAVAVGPHGQLVRINHLGPGSLRDDLTQVCLHAVARSATGKWLNITSSIRRRMPKILRRVAPARRFGPVQAKFWGATGEHYSIDARGTVQEDGKVIGRLASALRIEGIDIPSARR